MATTMGSDELVSDEFVVNIIVNHHRFHVNQSLISQMPTYGDAVAAFAAMLR